MTSGLISYWPASVNVTKSKKKTVEFKPIQNEVVIKEEQKKKNGDMRNFVFSIWNVIHFYKSGGKNLFRRGQCESNLNLDVANLSNQSDDLQSW